MKASIPILLTLLLFCSVGCSSPPPVVETELIAFVAVEKIPPNVVVVRTATWRVVGLGLPEVRDERLEMSPAEWDEVFVGQPGMIWRRVEWSTQRIME